MKQRLYLIRFIYDHYCQGYEDAVEYALVTDWSFAMACQKIQKKFKNARDFENLTLD